MVFDNLIRIQLTDRDFSACAYGVIEKILTVEILLFIYFYCRNLHIKRHIFNIYSDILSTRYRMDSALQQHFHNIITSNQIKATEYYQRVKHPGRYNKYCGKFAMENAVIVGFVWGR